MSVMITTHYIEESRNASKLAFMRFGRILIEESPQKLLTNYNATVLEDVFLKLCQADCGEIKKKFSSKKRIQPTSQHNPNTKQSQFNDIALDSTRLKALFFKNTLNLKRNSFIFFFYLILPVIQISLFCTSLHKTPDHLPVAIYNAESSDKGLSKQFFSLLNTRVVKVSTNLKLQAMLNFYFFL